MYPRTPLVNKQWNNQQMSFYIWGRPDFPNPSKELPLKGKPFLVIKVSLLMKEVAHCTLNIICGGCCLVGIEQKVCGFVILVV